MKDGLEAGAALVFSAGDLVRLRAELLADAPLESAAFILARPVLLSESRWRLIVAEVLTVERADYEERTAASIQLSATALARIAKRARQGGLTIIIAHTHPGRGPVGPSSVDLRGERSWVPAIRRRVPDAPHGRLILGFDDAHAAL